MKKIRNRDIAWMPFNNLMLGMITTEGIVIDIDESSYHTVTGEFSVEDDTTLIMVFGAVSKRVMSDLNAVIDADNITMPEPVKQDQEVTTPADMAEDRE